MHNEMHDTVTVCFKQRKLNSVYIINITKKIIQYQSIFALVYIPQLSSRGSTVADMMQCFVSLNILIIHSSSPSHSK